MASPVGGFFKFSQGTTKVNLGLTKTGGTAPAPSSVAGALNIEVITASKTGVLPTLKSGFTAGVIVSDTVAGDVAPHLSGKFPNELLTGRRLTLFGGNYKVTDSVTGSSNQRPARITAGSGNQTIVGAAHDTLIGGRGTQSIVGSKGHESILGGNHTYTIVGGHKDTIKGSNGATSITAGHVVGTAGSMDIALGKAGKYTVTAGAADTITSAAGSGSATITGVHSDSINLSGNTGRVSVVGSGKSTIVAGRGHETIKGGSGDRIGVGSGSKVGGTLTLSHATTAAGAIKFGTNDTVHSTNYNLSTHKATRGTEAGTSSAHVTVTNFRVGTDSLFYEGETSTLNADIVATSHTSNGNTTFTLPDGTVMTLIGVSHISTSFFKA